MQVRINDDKCLRFRTTQLFYRIMETILTVAQKGGAGKTTLARNLSVAAAQDGLKVLCLDLDPQGSLRAWWESRNADTLALLDRDPTPMCSKRHWTPPWRNSTSAMRSYVNF